MTSSSTPTSASPDFLAAVEQERRRLEVVHPTPEDIPGCMKLLDEFLSCNALGTQLKSFYRYGAQSECGRKLEDFKFCLSLKALDDTARRDAWIQRRAEWWAARRRLERSSEDVWEMRLERIENYPPVDVSSQFDAKGDQILS